MAIQGEPVAHNDLVSSAQTSLHSHAGGGGGFTPTYFQSVKSGNQSMSTSWADVTGWATASHTHSDYSFNTSTGIVTINTAGDYEFSASLLSLGGSSRTQAGIRIEKNGSPVAGSEVHNYSSRNTTQVRGSVAIPGFIITCAATDTLNLQAIYNGTSPSADAAGTWFQIRKIG